MSATRRTAHILGAVVVAVVLPALLMNAVAGQLGVWSMLTGILLGVVGSRIGGTRRMMFVAPAIGLAAGLGAFTAYGWGWVALLVIAAFVAGTGTRFGWHPALLMIPFAATFALPVPSATDALIFGVIVAIASGYGIVLARRFGAPEVVEADRVSTSAALALAIAFGIVLGAGAAIGVALSWSAPYWVPDPILVLILYILIGKRDRIRGKAIGTALGAAAAIPVAILAPPVGVITGLAIVAFLLALTQAKRYWLYYGLYTFSLVLVLAAPGQVAVEAKERGVQILVGIALLVGFLLVLRVLGRMLQERYPQLELAPNPAS
ncbi:MAG: hypothetical protein IPK93_01180 [Solirubrobacterales bacterium]|nr:hypothetical protein [Solirubrobacterales bacterium]